MVYDKDFHAPCSESNVEASVSNTTNNITNADVAIAAPATILVVISTKIEMNLTVNTVDQKIRLQEKTKNCYWTTFLARDTT